jgi:CBS domain-containing protein
MKVKEILEKKGTNVWTISEDATVKDVLGELVSHKIGALVVTDAKGEIAGIISERDIIRECFRNHQTVEKRRVSEVMTAKLIVGSPEDDLDYIMGIMTQNKIRHVPIVLDRKLAGMISIGDVVKAQLHDFEYENRYLKDYMFGRASGA